MNFEEYLKSKKIDPTAFKSGMPDWYSSYEVLFNQVHPNSFTQQKLFLINQIRRKYQLKQEEATTKPTTSKVMRPKIKPLKPKTS